jgi:hypothetical protein
VPVCSGTGPVTEIDKIDNNINKNKNTKENKNKIQDE